MESPLQAFAIYRLIAHQIADEFKATVQNLILAAVFHGPKVASVFEQGAHSHPSSSQFQAPNCAEAQRLLQLLPVTKSTDAFLDHHQGAAAGKAVKYAQGFIGKGMLHDDDIDG
jgi:hypothetical protein